LKSDAIIQAQIIFSLKKIRERVEALSQIARQYDINVLIAVKSSPFEQILNTVIGDIQGYDISNSQEFSLTAGSGFYFITNCPLSDLKFVHQILNDQYLISCNSPYYMQEITKKNLPFALRLRSTDIITNEKKLKSHFGLGIKQVLELKDQLQNNSLFSGFHFHHGGENNSISTYQSAIAAIKNLISDLGIKKNISINLGGGLANLSIKDFEIVLSDARQELGEHKIFIEPGRYFTERTGSCFAQVIDLQEDGSELMVNLNVSRECHLKWSRIDRIQVLKCAETTYRKKSKSITFYGNTCYENDLIGISHDSQLSDIGIGDTVVLSNISGYSLAWNTTFNGVPRVNVEFK
jgi:diaminopimelate decarboxylase